MYELKNWRNFQRASADLRERMFLVGPNASGKSNFLDAFKFLRDLTQPGVVAYRRRFWIGAVSRRFRNPIGAERVRILESRSSSRNSVSDSFVWKYSIKDQASRARGEREPYLVHEKVWRKGEAEPFVNRPLPDDKNDPKRLTQTYLEQISANEQFRPLANFLPASQLPSPDSAGH